LLRERNTARSINNQAKEIAVLGWGTVKAAAGKLALVIAAPILALALLEGLVSLVLAGRDFSGWRDSPNAEARHSRYDAELGWVNLPNVAAPNMYGPGIALHTNARGFRGRAETGDNPPPGRRRAICSGDSFTLGYGVGDEDTWCALLGTTLPDLETVNMGQGGYGFDQAYLWYRRDGLPLSHDIQIFAYITDDLRRMRHGRFDGYGKPVLALQGDSLVVTNVPAPEKGAAWRAGERGAAAIRGTRLFELTRRLALRSSARRAADSLARDSLGFDVAAAVIRRLADMHRGRGSTLIVVHLPTSQDYGTATADVLRRRMAAVAAAEGIRYVDLVASLRAQPPESVPALFIPRNGHYTPAGNRWVAGLLEPVIRGTGR
jgi:hypothetical protein